VVFNFDTRQEPKIKLPKDKNVIRTFHAPYRLFYNIIPGQPPKHKTVYTSYQNTLISDIPEDYLNIYANADAVYSDRIHACIASLGFGNYARLYSSTPRYNLFEKVGAEGIRKKIVKIDHSKIKTLKKEQINFLKFLIKNV